MTDTTSKGIELAEVALGDETWAIETPEGDLTFPGPEHVVRGELERIRESVANDDDDATDPEAYKAVRLSSGLAR